MYYKTDLWEEAQLQNKINQDYFNTIGWYPIEQEEQQLEQKENNLETPIQYCFPDTDTQRTLTRRRSIRRRNNNKYRHHRHLRLIQLEQEQEQISSLLITKECIICTDEKELDLFTRVTEECIHESSICRECVETHIRIDIEDRGNVMIRCPFGESCGILSEADVKRFVNEAIFERYQKLSVNSVLSQMPDFHYCLNTSCSSGHICSSDQICSSGEICGSDEIHYEGIMTCMACSHKSCIIHSLPITNLDFGCPQCAFERSTHVSNILLSKHAIITAFKYISKLFCRKTTTSSSRDATATEATAQEDARNKRKEAVRLGKLRKYEARSQKFIREKTKPCPRCSRRIQKTTGCDHMTCKFPTCGHEFCWTCLADYALIREEGNSQHLPSCKHYYRPS
ncbi:3647_t:CDS:2 [Ambispora gerdemannii]|uniref:RBR-type E3 ubiquitin transferase n=1 Tax=Ambispora gerdemannii TaxID=144530 RepID=A0A9N9CDQ1_9GLOM|nr:3647_t:CDS:2 [Ambispora gerdemannii]